MIDRCDHLPGVRSFPLQHSFPVTMIFQALVFILLYVIHWVQCACVEYTLDLTWEPGSPNGNTREMIYINGQFPGPPLIVDEGDDVTVSDIARCTRFYLLRTLDRSACAIVCHLIRQCTFMASSMLRVFRPTEPTTNRINRQLNTAWSDGVPGVTQWAIKPGESFRYQWHANTYGTYWFDLPDSHMRNDN